MSIKIYTDRQTNEKEAIKQAIRLIIKAEEAGVYNTIAMPTLPKKVVAVLTSILNRGETG